MKAILLVLFVLLVGCSDGPSELLEHSINKAASHARAWLSQHRLVIEKRGEQTIAYVEER